MYKRLKNPTYFVVGRESSFSDVGKIITFEQTKELGGSGMNKETGVYKAPKSSRYVFEFMGLGEANTAVSIRLNGEKVLASSSYFTAPARLTKTDARQEDVHAYIPSIKATVNLLEGDQISVFLDQGQLKKNSVFTGQIINDFFQTEENNKKISNY